MIAKQPQFENDMAEKMRSISALQQLSESELLQLLESILAIQADLQRIPLDDTLLEAIVYTQSLLIHWTEIVTAIFARKQANTTFIDLSNWDNEGGNALPNFV